MPVPDKLLIVIEGHSPNGDPGATGQGSTEAKETIQISNRIWDYILPHPNIAVDSDPDHMDFVESTAWINGKYPKLTSGVVAEIHKNAFNSNASGVEVLIGSGADAEMKRMAQLVVNRLAKYTGLPNRGVKERGDLYLINNCHPYAMLIEAGFIDKDPIDDVFDDQAARAIVDGMCEYWGEKTPAELNVKPPVVVEPPKPTVPTVIAIEPVYGKLFVFMKNTVLVNIPSGTPANVAGKLYYEKGEKIGFEEKLTYSNGKSFYRTKFWNAKKKDYGFDAAVIAQVEVIPPVVTPPVTPVEPPVIVEPTEPTEEIPMEPTPIEPTTPVIVVPEATTPAEVSAAKFVARIASQVAVAKIVVMGLAALLVDTVAVNPSDQLLGWATLILAGLIIFWAQFGYKLNKSFKWFF